MELDLSIYYFHFRKIHIKMKHILCQISEARQVYAIFTWKKRMIFQISPRTMDELPSVMSAASMLTSFTCNK